MNAQLAIGQPLSLRPPLDHCDRTRSAAEPVGWLHRKSDAFTTLWHQGLLFQEPAGSAADRVTALQIKGRAPVLHLEVSDDQVATS